MNDEALNKFADNLRATAGRMRANGAWLYEALMLRMAEDRPMLELALLQRDPIPMRLFFAVHFLLLDRPERPLADYFRTLNDPPLPPQEAYPAFRDYCMAHRDELQAILGSRTVQTTTVERAACLLPALARAAAHGEPMSIVELGCSAGLLLLFDEYRFDYGPAGATGRPDARLTVKLPVTGSGFVAPPRLPRVARRIGVDLGPVDPGDPLEHRWIRANLFPEWLDQSMRLSAALDIRATYPLETVRGDAIELLPALLDTIRGPLCVMHSGFMNYLTDAQRERLESILREHSRRRLLHKVGLDVTMPEFSKGVHRLFLRHTIYREGVPQETLLGDTDTLGQALAWRA
ncbi:MAG: DUF2332 domain-containing protein [Gammaproteobacteria bacterium]